MKLTGKGIKFGDNIDTDIIIAARYLTTSDPKELAEHLMEDLDSTVADRISAYKIIIGGKNFGCGSSREHAPIAIKGAGIGCVIAESFARIFYRNSLNIGLPIIENAEAAQKIDENNEIVIDFSKGNIYNITKNESYISESYPEFVQRIISEGGLVEYIKAEGVKIDDV
jgi:3-isopropylmalate/(R)-2-methylmalate dehydratase small subunit